MAKYIPDQYLNYALERIAESNQLVACTDQPATYFNACWAAIWLAVTAYSVGDLRRPPDNNGFIYECTIAGTSGALEPVWGTTQDEEFSDGTVTWKTHDNYSLAIADMVPGDFVFTDEVTGRRLTITGKQGITSHAAGTLTHVAIILSTDQTVRYVTTGSTNIPENDDIEAGRTIAFASLYVERENIV